MFVFAFNKLRTVSGLAACAVVLALSAGEVAANAAADYWPKARFGNKTCFTTHTHYGESTVWPSKASAERHAAREWERFTKWEYGPTWASYRLARVVNMKCNRSGSGWVCSTTAYPCRQG
ncbi:MAG: hypothetical protein ACFCUN_01075 [Hyphomicrobiaceae bacterium]